MKEIKINDGLHGAIAVFLLHRGVENFGAGGFLTYFGLAEVIAGFFLFYPFIKQFIKEN